MLVKAWMHEPVLVAVVWRLQYLPVLPTDPCLHAHRGKYGVVFKCEGKATKTPHALKLMLKKGNKKDDVLREVDVLKKISAHPGVLTFCDYIECTSEYILVTEL